MKKITKTKVILYFVYVSILVAPLLYALSPPNIFTSGTLIDSAQVNQNFQYLADNLNQLKFPDGIKGQTLITDLFSSQYTVPSGKTLYITQVYIGDTEPTSVSDGKFLIDDVYYYNIRTEDESSFWLDNINPIVIGENKTIKGTAIQFNGLDYKFLIFGFIINKNVEPINLTITNTSPYTVPSGKELYITYLHNRVLGGGFFTIDGVQLFPIFKVSQLTIPYLVKQGQTLSTLISTEYGFSGYLK